MKRSVEAGFLPEKEWLLKFVVLWKVGDRQEEEEMFCRAGRKVQAALHPALWSAENAEQRTKRRRRKRRDLSGQVPEDWGETGRESCVGEKRTSLLAGFPNLE